MAGLDTALPCSTQHQHLAAPSTIAQGKEKLRLGPECRKSSRKWTCQEEKEGCGSDQRQKSPC